MPTSGKKRGGYTASNSRRRPARTIGIDAVPGVGEAAQMRLRARGIRTLRDLARSDSALALQAQSLLTDSPIFSDITLQEGCAYLDIESRTFHRDVFLIGILYAGKNKNNDGCQYVALHADTEKKLATKYNLFLKNHMRGCRTIYHWGSYDAANMRRIGCNGTDRLCDMLKSFKRACLLPVSSYSIKEVAAYCKYDGYGQTDVSADMCGYLWDRYVHLQDTQSLDILLEYNRIDCEAMQVVYAWYAKQKPHQ